MHCAPFLLTMQIIFASVSYRRVVADLRYKAIMQRLKTHEFGLRATSRIKTFVFKFISVPAKWIKTSRRHVLNIYSDNNAYANLFKTDFG